MNIVNPWLTPYQRSYHQIKAKLIDGITSLTDSNGNQLISDVSEGNILVIIISAVAAIAEVLHYYIDTKAREFFLSTARRYSSVQDLGRLVGYYPKAATAATVDLVLTRTTGLNLSGTIAKGVTITVNNMTWMVTKDIQIQAYVNQVRVPLIQHRLYEIDTLNGTVISDASTLSIDDLPSGEFYEQGTMSLSIDGEAWQLVDTFAYSKSGDKHFRVEVNSDSTPVIIFGDDVHGKIPSPGSSISDIYCYITKGSTGNVGAGTITSVPFGVPLGTNFQASNEYPGSGGTDYEDIETMRDNIPLQVRTQGVAISKSDYEDLAVMVPGVGKAKVDYVCGRKVALYIYPDSLSGDVIQATDTLKQAVYNKLLPYLPITTLLKVYPIGTSQIVLDVSVTGKPNYKSEDITQHIYTALYNTYNATVSEIGGSVRVSDLYSLMDNLPSVDYLKINKFYVKPYVIPIVGSIGFNPYNFTLDKATKATSYYLVFNGGNTCSLIAKSGGFEQIINVVGENLIDDVSNGVTFNLTLFSSNNPDINIAGNKYEFTVSSINDDYTDTGFTIPIFSNTSNLTLHITETL